MSENVGENIFVFNNIVKPPKIGEKTARQLSRSFLSMPAKMLGEGGL